ncbi:uncharacterized protein K452DRAFT_289043 [Aplosporella prunicola CBS 121167]|uniref:RWD domain-containing protein n=1 Tax=Aplosporella prunicola CBS 121167 TaxID=1176127 RepID=A0A6A6BAK7_9PEZI|nr:uncharacterized protein K452DRAFT_289043 [Aplosporella prunicola CBS 121167]KAF2140284.1 hypothetical protein K452DRAFT_289043 [Aplosporella prunicola CBS 121167]
MNPALEDEITSINSIYDPDTESTLTVISSAPEQICALRLPSLPSVSLRLEFPPDYPDAPPSVLGTQTVGDDVPKGFGTRVVELVRQVLADVYQPGEPCVFGLVEDVGELVERERAATLEEQSRARESEEATKIGLSSPATAGHDASNNDGFSRDSLHAQGDDDDIGPDPPWILSEPFVEKKSVFLARAATVHSTAEAKQYVRHLLLTDKKAAKATHNMTAWRIKGEGDTTFQDCDDDGETAAGGRLLHLMQLMDLWDVMVIVSRWYGGVQLGPDRFRLINSSARDAFVRGGWAKDPKEAKEAAGGKKKGKK